MAASRGNTAQPVSEGLAGRVRRALIAAGWPALLFGAALGLLEARPNILPFQLPFEIPEGIFPILMMLAIGLLCGAIAGLWLYATSGLLRFTVAFFTVLVALISSEIVRGLLLNFSLWESLNETPDWLEAAQLATAAIGVALGVRSGRHTGAQPATVSAPARSTPVTSTPSRRANRPTRERSRTTSSVSSRRGGLAAAAAHPGGSTSMRVPRPAPTRAKPIKPKPKAKRTRRKVHLGRQVTSVCPYCLEEVTRNDPRGRVVCKICGTPHHGDCWAITGKCEVPHLQT